MTDDGRQAGRRPDTSPFPYSTQSHSQSRAGLTALIPRFKFHLLIAPNYSLFASTCLSFHVCKFVRMFLFCKSVTTTGISRMIAPTIPPPCLPACRQLLQLLLPSCVAPFMLFVNKNEVYADGPRGILHSVYQQEIELSWT
jgi:hypothetical protein